MKKHLPTVIVIGGGPAGMMAGIAAAEAGASVTLCERQATLGRKLLASGGGRCNLTNTLDPEAFMLRFGPRGRFMTDALRCLSRDALLATMREWGVPFATEDGFHYFPVSQKASDVFHALEKQLQRHTVHVRLGTPVTELEIRDGRIGGAVAGATRLPADAVVLAAGGAAWPALGGGPLGYELARKASHTLVDPFPALVGLTAREPWPRRCAGVTLLAAAWIDLPRFRTTVCWGPLLFTHTGVSGPAILDLSGQVMALLKSRTEVPLRIRLETGASNDTWRERLDAWRQTRGQKTVRNLLDEHLPQSLAAAACDACAIPADLRASRLDAMARDQLSDWLQALPLTITGSDGMEQAMVTRGGVSLREIDPANLGSRRVQGLHFCGEVVDLDGPCGGFNLQWAFSSGWLAGLSAARA